VTAEASRGKIKATVAKYPGWHKYESGKYNISFEEEK
jgi:hypothetical protein